MAQNNKKTQSNEVVVSMEHVNKWFGQFHVLRDINLSVNKGESELLCADRLGLANLP